MTRSRRATTLVVAILPLVVLTVAAPAQTLNQQITINGVRVGTPQPFIVRADAPPAGSGMPDPSLANAFNFTTPDGINLNGVGNLIVPVPGDPGFVFSCTAERIGPRSILTAAHCVSDPNTGAPYSTDGSAFARFLNGPSNTSPVFVDTPFASQVIVDPFNGGVSNPNSYDATDLAVVNFSSDLPSWVTTYSLFTGDPLGQQATIVGLGTYGGGVGAEGFDFGRRFGTNEVDYIDPDPTFKDFLELYTDFDSPTGPYDTFCVIGLVCDRGTSSEAGTAEGDSGGPLFINGQIAGVTSFGAAICDPRDTTECVPFVADPSRPSDSFGALNGFAPVDPSIDFIDGAVEAAEPEPATLALMATGMLFIGGVAYRRRTISRAN